MLVRLPVIASPSREPSPGSSAPKFRGDGLEKSLVASAKFCVRKIWKMCLALWFCPSSSDVYKDFRIGGTTLAVAESCCSTCQEFLQGHVKSQVARL